MVAMSMLNQDKLNKAILKATEIVFNQLVNKYECGWFDGGCYTLSVAIADVIPHSKIYHVSRNSNLRDHAVVFLPEINKFIDADGIQSQSELITKMKEIELVNVTVCEPFNDINSHIIYGDIKKCLIQEIINQLKKFERINNRGNAN